MRLCLPLDEFILDGVVNNNEVPSDADASTTHARPFDESSFSAVISKGSTIGLHNAYIALGTFATAIFIVAIVVSIYFGFSHFIECFGWSIFICKRSLLLTVCQRCQLTYFHWCAVDAFTGANNFTTRKMHYAPYALEYLHKYCKSLCTE